MIVKHFSIKFGRKFIALPQHRSLTKIKLPFIPRPHLPLNITVCGANSNIGRMSTLLFKRESIFKNLFLWDDIDLCELASSDLSNIKTSTKIETFCGKKQLIDAVTNSRIVYICNDIQTTPGITPIDLFKQNVNYVRQIVLYVSEFNQKAMIVIVTPSVTSLVPMAIEEFRKNDYLADNQVFGVARTYLSRVNSIASDFIEGGSDMQNYVIGGCDKDTCVPVFSNSSQGKNLREQKLKNLIDLFENSEENALKTNVLDCNVNGCYLSLANSGFQFTLNLAKALNGEKNITDCAFVKQKNPKDYNERYLTCKVHLDKEGLASCEIPKLSGSELKHLKSIGKQLNKYIHAGEVYINGTDQRPVFRPKIIIPKIEPPAETITKFEPLDEVFCKKRPKLKTLIVGGKN